MLSNLTKESNNDFCTENFSKVAPHSCFHGGQVIINPQICQLASELLVKMGKETNRDRVLVNSLIFPVMKNVAGETEPG